MLMTGKTLTNLKSVGSGVRTAMNAAMGSKVRSALEKVDSEIRLHHYKIRNFKPNVRIRFERGHFIVKTAETGAELEECLRLRFEVFHKEYMCKARETGVDVDWLDFSCDHLMITDKRTSRIVGTYRLNSSLYSNEFYSGGEFHIKKILEMPGVKLELGRACIGRNFRTGAVIALLWRGIAEFIRVTDTRVLFGCSSIKTMEPMQIANVHKHFVDLGVVVNDYKVEPTKKFRVPQLAHALEFLRTEPEESGKRDVEALIPPLFQSYLRMGAKLCGEPALDRDFRCIDYLTVIRTEDMHPSIREKYAVK